MLRHYFTPLKVLLLQFSAVHVSFSFVSLLSLVLNSFCNIQTQFQSSSEVYILFLNENKGVNLVLIDKKNQSC